MMGTGPVSTKINDLWGQLHIKQKIIAFLTYSDALTTQILYVKLNLKDINIYCYEANVRQGT